MVIRLRNLTLDHSTKTLYRIENVRNKNRKQKGRYATPF